MEAFNEYLTGQRPGLPERDLNRIVKRYEWFTTARRARMLAGGRPDSRLILPLNVSVTIPPPDPGAAVPPPGSPSDRPSAATDAHEIRSDGPRESRKDDMEMIDRFLVGGGYRITPSDGGECPGTTPAEVFETGDGEFLTEELAEIYRSQGLLKEAVEIYRKLSLRNPEKSIYFADVISRIELKDNS